MAVNQIHRTKFLVKNVIGLLGNRGGLRRLLLLETRMMGDYGWFNVVVVIWYCESFSSKRTITDYLDLNLISIEALPDVTAVLNLPTERFDILKNWRISLSALNMCQPSSKSSATFLAAFRCRWWSKARKAVTYNLRSRWVQPQCSRANRWDSDKATHGFLYFYLWNFFLVLVFEICTAVPK